MREIRLLFAAAGLTDIRVVMKEYPGLGQLYARRGWPWLPALRDELTSMPAFNVFGLDFVAMGTKPRRR